MTLHAPPVVSVAKLGDLGLIDIENPPVNALSWAVRFQLLEALEALDVDPTIRVVVIFGQGQHFVAGADVREFGEPARAPNLIDVLSRLEACAKPVVAALHATSFGGGAELALACHYRAAGRGLAFGFPEIKLGLMPGAGGAVRLPRIVGVEKALELMLTGAALDFDTAWSLGLLDRELGGDCRGSAIAYAREIARARSPLRRLSEQSITAPASHDFFAQARASLPAVARRLPAADYIIDALEAATVMPFEPSLQRSRELFEACRRSRESQALRHLFLAERGGTALPGPVASIERVGIIGAGTMGRGIAINAVMTGYSVVLVDSESVALEFAQQECRRYIDNAVGKGRLSREAGASAVARLEFSANFLALASADLIIEAVYENLAVKQNVFARLGSICSVHAVLATNTSTLDVDVIAAASGRAADVVGMHFFSPPHLMRLLEIVRGRFTSERAVATAHAVARRLGKRGLLVGNGFGFVGNRMLYAYGREKELMMLEGATPERIDLALEAFGMAMGPNAVGDLTGLDVGYRVRKEWRDRPRDPRFYRVSDLLVESGRLGRKTGCGFYRYVDDARRGVPDPCLPALIRAEGERLGVVEREVGDEEIVERCMTALINEGARVLDDGIAASPADIDVIWCNGYGFPRDRGGPLFYADTLGLRRVVERIRSFASQSGAAWWEPSAGLVQKAAAGVGFYR